MDHVDFDFLDALELDLAGEAPTIVDIVNTTVNDDVLLFQDASDASRSD